MLSIAEQAIIKGVTAVCHMRNSFLRRRRRSTPQPLAGEALGAALTRSQIPVSPVCKLCYNRGQTPKQGDAGRARADVPTGGRPAHGRAAQKIAPKFSNKENLP